MVRSLELSNFSKSIRKYQVNDYFLDKINSPNKAYILGLFYADGYNNEKKNRIIINLEQTDREILEKIKNEFEYTGPLLYDKKDGIRRPQYRLSINNKRLSESLNLWGCMQKKTEILKFPNFLSDKLTRHFIRGYFDGDGCISSYGCRNNPYTYYEFGLIGTEHLVLGCLNYLKDKLNLPFCVQKAYRRKNKEGNILIKEGRISGKGNMISIMEFLYKDCDLKMKRKFDKYLTIKNNGKKCGRDHNSKPVKIYLNKNFIKVCKSIKKTSEYLNISQGTVRLCIRNNRSTSKGYSFKTN